MLSTDELRLLDGSFTRFLAPTLPAMNFKPAPDDAFVPVDDSTAVAYRLHKPHPRFSALSDSTSEGVLDILEELVLLTQVVRARVRSRLAGAGVLFLDDRITTKPQEATPDEDPYEDPFMQRLRAGDHVADHRRGHRLGRGAAGGPRQGAGRDEAAGSRLPPAGRRPAADLPGDGAAHRVHPPPGDGARHARWGASRLRRHQPLERLDHRRDGLEGAHPAHRKRPRAGPHVGLPVAVPALAGHGRLGQVRDRLRRRERDQPPRPVEERGGAARQGHRRRRDGSPGAGLLGRRRAERGRAGARGRDRGPRRLARLGRDPAGARERWKPRRA